MKKKRVSEDIELSSKKGVGDRIRSVVGCDLCTVPIVYSKNPTNKTINH